MDGFVRERGAAERKQGQSRLARSGAKNAARAFWFLSATDDAPCALRSSLPTQASPRPCPRSRQVPSVPLFPRGRAAVGWTGPSARRDGAKGGRKKPLERAPCPCKAAHSLAPLPHPTLTAGRSILLLVGHHLGGGLPALEALACTGFWRQIAVARSWREESELVCCLVLSPCLLALRPWC